MKDYNDLRGNGGIQQQAALIPNKKRAAEMSVNSPESKKAKSNDAIEEVLEVQQESISDIAKIHAIH